MEAREPVSPRELEFQSAYLKTVLVVDNSKVVHQMMRLVLQPYADEIIIASGLDEAVQKLNANRDIRLVLSGTMMVDGDGFQLLERLSEFNDPRPRAIVISASHTANGAQRAAELGAIGYLPKPARPRDILRLVKDYLRARAANPRAPRRRSRARAFCVESVSGSHRPQSCPLRDVSVTGAFLEMKTPIPLATELDLTLDFEDTVLEARAEVVRHQDTTSEHSAGVGVAFIEPDNAVVDLLQEFVADAGGDVY